MNFNYILYFNYLNLKFELFSNAKKLGENIIQKFQNIQKFVAFIF